MEFTNSGTQIQDSKFLLKAIDKLLLDACILEMFYKNIDPHQMSHLLTISSPDWVEPED